MAKMAISKDNLKKILAIGVIIIFVILLISAALIAFLGTINNTNDDNEYVVSFVDWDNSAIKTENIKYGGAATSPTGNPTKPSTDQYNYTFTGWDTEFNNVTGELKVTAIYKESLKSYSVIFNNWDGATLKTESVEYGSFATAPESPTKTATTQYTYIFDSWDKAFDNITGQLTVTAQFNESINVFEVVFKNWDDTVLKTESVEYGSFATAPESPTKTADAQFTYTFSSWDKTFNNITESLTVTAIYSESINIFEVVFINWDGTILKTESVEYGSFATAPESPTKAATTQYTYIFDSWDKTFDNITESLTVTAIYNSNIIQYTVSFVTNCDNLKQPILIDCGSILEQPDSPINLGYELDKWYADESLTIEYTFDQIVTANIVLYASWIYVGTSGLMFVLINEDTEYEVSQGTITATEVIIPSTYRGKPVTTIASSAFSNNSTMTSIVIPESITTIKACAFMSCSELLVLDIPDTVTSIENLFAFGADLIHTLKTPTRFPGAIFEFDGFVTMGTSLPNLKTLVIKQGASGIANSAFLGNSILENITLPTTIVSIGDYAFKNCSSLKAIDFHNGLTTIGLDAFQNCASLSNISIPSSVTYIHNGCFSLCAELKNVTLLSSELSIGYNAFYYDNNLEMVTLSATTPPTLEDHVFVTADSNYNVSILENLVILVPNESVSTYKATENWLYYKNRIYGATSNVSFNTNGGTTVPTQTIAYLGSAVMPIAPTKDSSSFAEWYEDEELLLPYSFTTQITYSIVLYAKWCNATNGLAYNLIDSDTAYEVRMGVFTDPYIYIPSMYNGKPVTSIGRFSQSSIIGVYIPSTIKRFYIDYSFIDCTELANIDIDPDNMHFCTVDGVLFNKSKTTLELYPKADTRTNYIIPSGTEKIECGSFQKTQYLLHITVPNSVWDVLGAFSECETVTTIVFESGSEMVYLGSCAFQFCTSLTTINLPESLTEIGSDVFQYCTSLVTLIIPAFVDTINGMVFENCTSLVSLTVLAPAPPHLFIAMLL